MNSGATSGMGMRFAVDGWDPSYGSTFDVDDELADTTANVQEEVELPRADWRRVSETVFASSRTRARKVRE